MRTPRTVVIVPCYNTSSACSAVLRGAMSNADAVLAVDDGSTDDTAVHIRRSGCALLQFPVNQGKGAALEAGFIEALGGRRGLLSGSFDFVVTLDGDGQHDPRDIPRMVQRATGSGADLILGIRDVNAMPPKSRFGNNTARLFFALGTGLRIADAQCGFRLFSRALAESLISAVSWTRYETEAEILFRAVALGARIETVEIPTIYFDGNRATHFAPFADSMRVFGVLSCETAAALIRRLARRLRPGAADHSWRANSGSGGSGTHPRSRCGP